MSSQRRRRSRASTDMTGAEMAFGFSLVSALLLLVGLLGLLQPAPPNPLSTFSVMVRSGAWQSIGLGLALAFAAAFLWPRLVLSAAAFAKTGLTRDDLRKLSPEQFEQWCAARLREQGFRVSEVGGQGDHGVDLIAERGDERIVVQCKRWFGIRLVGEPQVRDLYGAMHHESATGAMVITTGVFSEPALAWARGKPVLLWDVERLIGRDRKSVV